MAPRAPDHISPDLRSAPAPGPGAGGPNLSSIASASLRASPTPINKTRADANGISAVATPPMTGVAAMVDERRRQRRQQDAPGAQQQSPNPAKAALGSLIDATNHHSPGGGGGVGMSRPQDGPRAATTTTTTMSEGMASAAEAINMQNDPMQVDQGQGMSPTMSSLGASYQTVGSPAGITSNMTQSPGPMAPTNGPSNRDDLTRVEGKTPQPRSMTFPGPQGGDPPGGNPHSPVRGMSLPMPGYDARSPRSPGESGSGSGSSRKHRCPYCATEFTRHHNLKSHLLTHSHEKPFVCATCSLRFRRLHDLKRHSKLHTGERPHICPKCGRRFARGDALARHNKGQGGCAGRRSSLGGYDDEYGEGESSRDGGGGARGGGDDMDGLVYAEGGAEDPDDLRSTSLPGIQAHHRPHAPETTDRQAPYYQHSTYPPASATHHRGSTSGGRSLMPPTHEAPAQGRAAPVFSHGKITESPGPLSPAHAEGGQGPPRRSPSLNQQTHQHPHPHPHPPPYGHARSPPAPGVHPHAPPVNLPPPQPSNGPLPPQPQPPPQLPSLPGLAPPDSRYTLPSQAQQMQQTQQTQQTAQYGQPPPQPPPQSMPQTGSGGSGTSALSGGTGSGGTTGTGTGMGTGTGGSSSQGQGSGDGSSNNLFAPVNAQDNLWAYVRTLEERLERLTEEFNAFKSQVAGPPQR